jgi:hypothetical protein
VTIFQGARLQATIRETIQNSLDACQDLTKPVEVYYSLQKIDITNCDALVSLEKPFTLAFEEELTMSPKSEEEETEALSFYRKGLANVFSKRSTLIFGIHDFNTSGLGGNLVESQGEKPGQWLALVKGAGVDVKDDPSSLGSFGQGAKAPFALSELRSLFYLSRLTPLHGNSSLRFQGKALLSSFWQQNEDGDPTLRVGLGYFGIGNDQNAIEDEDVPSWASEAREMFGPGQGTSILLPAPYGVDDNNPSQFLDNIKLVVLTNFYFALANKKLVVVLHDGTRLDDKTCKQQAINMGVLNAEPNPDWDATTLDKVEVLKTLIDPDHYGIKTSREFEDFYWAIRIGENAPGKKVGIARKTGMLISRTPPKFERFPGLGNFDLFICVTGHKGSLVLKSLENPAHDAFEEDRISDPVKRKATMEKYKKFVAEVREILNEHAKLQVDQEELTSDLNDLLSGEFSDESGQENRIEFTRKVRIQKGRKKIRLSERKKPGGKPIGGKGGKGGRGKRVLPNATQIVRNAENLTYIHSSKDDSAEIYFDFREGKFGILAVYKSGDQGVELLQKIEFDESNLVKGTRFMVQLQNVKHEGAIEAEVQEISIQEKDQVQ